MRLKFCCICGTTNDLHHHHIIPRSRGGTDDETNYLTLCGEHHGWIHSIRPNSWNNHPQLIREGQERARKQGKHLGRPTKVDEKIIERVKFMRELGISTTKIARDLKIGVGTVYKITDNEYDIKECKLNKRKQGTLEKFFI